MRAFVNHIEIWLSLAGLAIILAVPQFFRNTSVDAWMVAAVTATGVGVLHGVIFWIIRNRQRHVRARAIAEIQEMLTDVVRNELSVISMNTRMLERGQAAQAERSAGRIKDAIHHISGALGTLSNESLTHWQGRYQSALTAIDAPGGTD